MNLNLILKITGIFHVPFIVFSIQIVDKNNLTESELIFLDGIPIKVFHCTF